GAMLGEVEDRGVRHGLLGGRNRVLGWVLSGTLAGLSRLRLGCLLLGGAGGLLGLKPSKDRHSGVRRAVCVAAKQTQHTLVADGVLQMAGARIEGVGRVSWTREGLGGVAAGTVGRPSFGLARRRMLVSGRTHKLFPLPASAIARAELTSST